MSIRTVLIVVFALVFGVAAAVMAGQFSLQRQVQSVETAPVVVAAADIPRFSMVVADQVKIKEFPKDLVPPGALTRIEDAVGRVAYAPVVQDEPLHNARLAGKGAGRGLSAVIPQGMQAITIQTPNVAVGVAGFILPGNRVDVLLTTGGHSTIKGGPSTVTLLNNVEILAVDQRVEAPADNKVDPKELRSVTLLVTPEQAGRLTLGQSNGTLHLALRNPEDQQSLPTRRTTLQELGFPPETVAKEPAAVAVPGSVAPAQPLPPPIVFRTLRGNNEGTITVGPADGSRASTDGK